MLGDRRTLEMLDFAPIRDRVVALTATERGSQYAQSMLPFVDFERVKEEQQATQALIDLSASGDLPISRAADTKEATAAATRGVVLSSADVRALGDALAVAAAAYNKTCDLQATAIARVTQAYRPLRDLVQSIAQAIDERGTVLDGASPALRRIRRSLVTAQHDARERVSALLRSSQYARALQDDVVTIREGRFVVPIKTEFSGAVRGIVHDTSSTGQTVFVEPLEALEINNRVRTLRLEETREVERILSEFSQQIAAEADQIEANVEMLARIDVWAAKAQLSARIDGSMPELLDDAAVQIVAGRHPLLGNRAVPQTILFGETANLIVISGPNMGGKTVALKMVGLFVCMTYCGLALPARSGTRIGRFTRIFADIGDEQSIAENTSTFSAHLVRLREIVANAGAQSLVLIDEIGGGTEPAAGAALAIAILERLVDAGVRGVVTTHSTELKLFAQSAHGVINANVRFDPKTFSPTYELDLGAPGQSLAFPLAQAMQLPATLIARAEELLSDRERDYERAIAQLSQTHGELTSESKRLEEERARVVQLQQELRAQAEALKGQQRELADLAAERLRRALLEFTTELQRRAESKATPKVTPSQSALLSRLLDDLHRDIGLTAETHDAPPAVNLESGQRVHVLSLDQDAEVIADAGEHLLVAIGPMRTTVGKHDVRPIGEMTRRSRAAGGAASLGAASTVPTELDVRGKRYIEAEPIVERWIDEAVLAGHSPLRLIHGKGTGLLGRGLQQYLRDHAAVAGVRYGNEDEGGSGVTVFELR